MFITGNVDYQQIISIGTHKGITLVDCEKEGEKTELWGRPFLKVVEGPVEPFTRTLAVWFMNQEYSHSVNRRGGAHLPHFYQESDKIQRKLKKVAMVRRRSVD